MNQEQAIIIDTGVANTASVLAALKRCGTKASVSAAPGDVERAAFVVLPGVGAFAAGMDRLNRAGLVAPLLDRISSGRPTLAICLGMQLLCRASEESPSAAGLGMIDAEIGSFPEGVRRPQFGWNLVTPGPGCTGITSGYAYFANSYRLGSAPAGWSAAMSEHGGPFVAALERGGVLACQFHPELSGVWGSELLRGWIAKNREALPC